MSWNNRWHWRSGPGGTSWNRCHCWLIKCRGCCRTSTSLLPPAHSCSDHHRVSQVSPTNTLASIHQLEDTVIGLLGSTSNVQSQHEQNNDRRQWGIKMSFGGNCYVIVEVQFSPVMTHHSSLHFGGLNSLTFIRQKCLTSACGNWPIRINYSKEPCNTELNENLFSRGKKKKSTVEAHSELLHIFITFFYL